MVWDVGVEELSREFREEIDGVSLELQLGDVRLFILNVEVTGGTSDATLEYAGGVGDLAETMPVFHVVGDRGGLETVGNTSRVDLAVDRRLETEHEGFNRPLKLDKMDAVGALVQVLSLATVDTHQGEGNTVNEDVMDFREYEHVVNVQIESGDLWGRERRRGKSARRGTRVDNRVVKVGGLGKTERNETLTVRHGHRRERKARVHVEPEQKWNPQVQVVMSRLRRLVTVKHLGASVSSDRGGTIAVGLKSSAGVDRSFLAHATVPSSTLVRWHVELTVEHVSLAGVRIDRVGVDFESDFIKETLTWVVTVTVKNAIRSVSTATRERSRRSTDDNVGNHVSEEITVLRNRDRYIRTKRDVVGRGLKVLERNRDIWLVVSIHKENVRTFKIRKGWVRVRLTGSGTTSLHRRNVITEKVVGE